MRRFYYPRLSALSDDPPKMVDLINQQLHLALLIATPLLVLAMVLAQFFVPIMYSAKFTEAIPQIQWLAFGTIFKVISWPIAFTLLAKK
jgi:O-antigen/teichoic acid export membrane protein